TDPSGKAVLGGSISGGVFVGGTAGFYIDTNSLNYQWTFGPWAGVDVGAKLQGSYDPTGSLGDSGSYIIPTANFIPGIGASYSYQQPIDFSTSIIPKLGSQSPRKWNWGFGAEVGTAVCLCYQSQPSSLSGAWRGFSSWLNSGSG